MSIEKLVHDVPFLLEAALRQLLAARRQKRAAAIAGAAEPIVPAAFSGPAHSVAARPNEWFLPETPAEESPADQRDHRMIVGPSGKRGSLLSRLCALAPDRLGELEHWSSQQPAADGVIDMMAWPGWAEIGPASVHEGLRDAPGGIPSSLQRDCA